MQNQINLTPITQFIQQMRSAELGQSKELKIPIQQARLLNLAIAELMDKVNQDYQSLYAALKGSQNSDIITVSMDGGGFEDGK